MIKTWLNGLSDKDKEEIKQIFLSNARLRERVKVILQDKIDTARKNNRASDAYDSPNWAYKQADAMGYERAMHEIINLFDN